MTAAPDDDFLSFLQRQCLVADDTFHRSLASINNPRGILTAAFTAIRLLSFSSIEIATFVVPLVAAAAELSP